MLRIYISHSKSGCVLASEEYVDGFDVIASIATEFNDVFGDDWRVDGISPFAFSISGSDILSKSRTTMMYVVAQEFVPLFLLACERSGKRLVRLS